MKSFTVRMAGQPFCHTLIKYLALGSLIFLSACGGGEGGSVPKSLTTIQAKVSGLMSTGLVLKNNKDTLTVEKDGAYHFANKMELKSIYTVTVANQPSGQICTVLNGNGIALSTDTITVEVVCSVLSYAISGSVVGLHAGNTVTLFNNQADPIVVSGENSFRFNIPIAHNGSYAVTVGSDPSHQPTDQVCTVTNGVNDGITADVTNVMVVCDDKRYTVSGRVTGLGKNESIVLKNNGQESLVIAVDGPFSFITPIAHNSAYSVSLAAGLPNKTCTVNNGIGSSVTADVTDVVVICSVNRYTIPVAVSGLEPGKALTLQNNGIDALIISKNGLATFPSVLAYGAQFNVTIRSQPFLQGCTLKNGTGTVLKDLAAVEVACAPPTYTIRGTFDGINGALPSGLMEDNGSFYGTTKAGGKNNLGTIFSLNASSGIKTLFSFTKDANNGAQPVAGLIKGRDGYLYGTTTIGGKHNAGMVYKISPLGATTMLASLSGSGASFSYGGLIQDKQGVFYGTTAYGGQGAGTIFTFTSETDLVDVHTFSRFPSTGPSRPFARLLIANDGQFYGTTIDGGAYGSQEAGYGTLFKMTPSGAITLLHSFEGGLMGNSPQGSLTQGVDGALYGTTALGGQNNAGTIFKLGRDGVFRTLYVFKGTGDGAHPLGDLVQANGGTFYGVTAGQVTENGTYSQAVLYQVTINGDFKVIHTFTQGQPSGNLLLGTDGNFYGTTTNGGANNKGSVFRFGAP